MNKLRKAAAEAAATVFQPPAFPDPVSAPVTQPSLAAIPSTVDHSHSASNDAWNEIEFADEEVPFLKSYFCIGCYLL